LQLPARADIHHVFHVSQLKKHIGPRVVPQDNLPMVTKKAKPVAVLDTRALPRNDEIVTQWKLQWVNISPDQATWEDKLFIKATFPDFYHKTIREWWPHMDSRGQEFAQEGGSCQAKAELCLKLGEKGLGQ
jgi:hypothetical protein